MKSIFHSAESSEPLVLVLSSAQVNHSFPEKIVIYRDGVSEGQLALVEQHEIPQLIKTFEKIGNYEPKLVFFSVQKRINTTLYARMSNTYSPPPPGTILDHTLTKRDWSVRARVVAAVNSHCATMRVCSCIIVLCFSLQGGFLSAGTQHPPRLRSSHALHLPVQHIRPVNRSLAEVKHQSG